MFSNMFASLLLAAAAAPFVLAGNHFAGVVVSNSVGGANPYTPRNAAQWQSAVDAAKAAGFPAIRLEGFDNNALDLASQAAKNAGIKVLAGNFIGGTVASQQAAIDADVQLFINAAKKFGPDLYTGFTVGNEVQDSAAALTGLVNSVKGRLAAEGLASVKVTSAHTFPFILDNKFCAGDFISANAYSFFDPPSTSANTENFIHEAVIPSLSKACPGKELIISESGWASAGQTTSKGVASLADENIALSKLNCAARDVKIFAFEFDDQPWKGNAAERSFGIFGKVDLNANVFKEC